MISLEEKSRKKVWIILPFFGKNNGNLPVHRCIERGICEGLPEQAFFQSVKITYKSGNVGDLRGGVDEPNKKK